MYCHFDPQLAKAVGPIHCPSISLCCIGNPTYGYTYGHLLPHLYYGKREAEAAADPQLITYANGAVVPADPANLAATSAHLAAKGHLAYYHHGLAYAYDKTNIFYRFKIVSPSYGKRSAEPEAEAAPQLLYALPYAHHVLLPALVAHPNGAVVPLEPADVGADKIFLTSWKNICS